MNEDNGRFRKKPPRKKEPVTRVVLSADAIRAYEDLAKKRDERERDYGRHLGQSEKR